MILVEVYLLEFSLWYGDGTELHTPPVNFDGTGDFLQIPTGDYLGFDQTEDFTLDMFLYPTTLGSDDGIFTTNDNNTSLCGVVLHTRDTSKLEFRAEGCSIIFNSYADLTNLYVADRHNGVTRIYINGPHKLLILLMEVSSLTQMVKDYREIMEMIQQVWGVGLLRDIILILMIIIIMLGIDNFRYTKGYSDLEEMIFLHNFQFLVVKLLVIEGWIVRGHHLFGGGDDVSLRYWYCK